MAPTKLLSQSNVLTLLNDKLIDVPTAVVMTRYDTTVPQARQQVIADYQLDQGAAAAKAAAARVEAQARKGADLGADEAVTDDDELLLGGDCDLDLGA